MYATRQYTQDSQANSRNNNSLTFEQPSSSQSYRYYSNSNYQPPTTSNYPNDKINIDQHRSAVSSYGPSSTNNLTSSIRYSSTSNYMRTASYRPAGTGAIEKTNMMSSENPFVDPARRYEQLMSPRKITSIVSPPKTSGGINKSLNLSDENPFHAIYGNYRYPSQVDQSKRITTQTTAIRSTENKSLNLSDDNPFFSTYERYRYPSQTDPQKRTTETSKTILPLLPIKDLSNDNLFNTYRPSLIREYSTNAMKNEFSLVTTSIADWIRNNPAPLSYRPIQVQRLPSGYYNQQESLNESSFLPSLSAPSQRRPLSPPTPTLARIQSQHKKVSSSLPLDKTSLNMSPDNPFAQTYGRYHYPSAEEIKAQKRATERNTHLIESQFIVDDQKTQTKNEPNEFPEIEKDDTVSSKGNKSFYRFDITF